MKSYAILAAAVGTSLFLIQPAFSQMTASSNPQDTRGTATNPHAVVNNTVPTNAGAGTSNASQWGRANSVYTEHEIEKAKADGKDVTVAQAQYRMGMKALNTGLNKEAAQHFDQALRSVGVEPKAQGQNPGESLPGHAAMPGDTHP
jgi:hypothetical protein